MVLYAPAGVVAQATPVRRAARRLAAHGLEVRIDEAALAKHQRFAGDDETRLAAIHRVARSGASIAMAIRGGYGLTRLLDRIDYPLLQRSVEQGMRWVGHSDCTVLQLALLAHGKCTTWAGPMAAYDFGGESVDEVTEACFLEAMRGELEAVGFRTEAGFDGLELKGTLWGGNLTMLTSLLGTPHLPRVRGGILFLEDVNEHPYRIERCLLQLHQAGVLEAQKAVVLGRFTEFRKSPLDRGYGLKSVVDHLRSVTSVPVLTGLPFGHVATKVTLPVGARVRLVVQGRDVLVAW
ncbi:muramoyltetrapeptide carboxypeptidase [Caldimonas thermodepolymerans]|uniref:Muramoyltetrapeptide carboxypeptidase n=1 Tax=Caldimonas thermodepolymerans TaxID=215580 RepID=A0AA46DHQ1_9BURK|nr:muramoyltetrapeptide carboxypeptidase [Caldimonas thermodepolymerans]TCP10077.1 muramoyltetrapeptide carboxypeptidase [Caldimonas thermodepolymerans]